MNNMTKHKVLHKQKMSERCIICGVYNPIGVKANFYELDNGEVVALCTIKEDMQSYPDRVHGGILSTLLDETIGRVIMIGDEDAWGVTAMLNVHFKKPVPLDTPLKVVGRITRRTRLIFEGTGEILLPDGTVAVTAWGKYMKMSLQKITGPHTSDILFEYPLPNDPEYIEY